MQVKNHVSNHKIFMTGRGWGRGIYEQNHFFLHYMGYTLLQEKCSQIKSFKDSNYSF